MQCVRLGEVDLAVVYVVPRTGTLYIRFIHLLINFGLLRSSTELDPDTQITRLASQVYFN